MYHDYYDGLRDTMEQVVKPLSALASGTENTSADTAEDTADEAPLLDGTAPSTESESGESGDSGGTGSINIVDNAQNGTAVSDNAVVTIESGCTWILTGDCTLTSLTNNGTINFNGYTITLADGTVLQ